MDTLLDQSFPAATESLAAVRSALRTVCQQLGCSEDCSGELVLAVNEACMNIIQHGYAFTTGQQFQLRLLRDGDMLRVQLLDNGRVASLADLCPRALEDLRPGGLGVRFMREVTEAVEYLPPPAGFSNLLQLSKRIK